MPLTLKIKVTKDVLKASKMCGFTTGRIGRTCAVAVAVRDVFPHVSVGTDRIFFFRNDDNTDVLAYCSLPVEARKFLEEFDCASPEERVKMGELEFEIQVPDIVVELLNIDDVKEILKECETIELVE